MASTCFGVVGRRTHGGGLKNDLGRCADPAVIPITFYDASIGPGLAGPGGQGKAMEDAVMNPDEWEQRALDSIKDGLTGSDPQLAALLATFTRLASGEEMPVRDELQARPLRAIRRSRRKRRHPGRGPVRGLSRRLGIERVALLLWLLITILLITTGVTLSRSGSHSGCIERWPGICADAAPAHSSPGRVRN